MWRAVLAVLLVVLPLTALMVVPAVGAADPALYSQMNNATFDTPNSTQSVDLPAPYDTDDSFTADDFTVPAQSKWQITQVDAQGYPGLDKSQPASFNLFIYTNVANKPGARIFSSTGLGYAFGATSPAGSFNYSISWPSGPVLTEGTYWIVIQGNATTADQGWRWWHRTTQNGTSAQYYSPGASGPTGTHCDTGFDRRGSCFFNTGAEPDQVFALFGKMLENQPPVNTVPGPQTVNDNVNLAFSTANGNAISVDDPEIQAGENLFVQLDLSPGSPHGTLTLGSTTGLILVYQNGTDAVAIAGTRADLNAALQTLVYNPNDGYGGLETLKITTNDQGHNGTGPIEGLNDIDTVAITVKARTKITGVSGTVQYGGTGANLNACLGTVSPIQPGTDLSGKTITFKVGGNVVGTGTTNSAGCATFTGDITNPGLNAGSYANRVTAEFAGSTYLLPSSGTGTLTVQRRILWVKPVDRTVQLKKANPPTDPHQDPANCAAPSWCLELSASRGSSFAPGESFANLNLANLRFQYARNPPSTNAAEYVGKTYRITAAGVNNANYDIRYDPGTMTVVPVAP
ncbi:MAG: hypothetical protein U0232_04805 [Thermomicrobiales bacterium]